MNKNKSEIEKNSEYLVQNTIIRVILKFLFVMLLLSLLQLLFGSIILGKIYSLNSELYFIENSVGIPDLERKFISNKISNCQKFNENRYIINPLNFFIDNKELQIHIKSNLEKCLIEYVLNSNDNREMNYRKTQTVLILNKPN